LITRTVPVTACSLLDGNTSDAMNFGLYSGTVQFYIKFRR